MTPEQTMGPLSPYVFFDNALSPEQCDHLIAIGKAITPLAARVGDGSVAEGIRKSSVAWLHRQDAVEYVYMALAQCAAKVNIGMFPCDTTSFGEPIQLTRYSESGDHYGWHQDMGDGAMRTRKLSVVTLLSDPADFDGGTLEIFGNPCTAITQPKRGAMVAFPSYAWHRVNALTSGERWSMVAWLHGPVWR